MTLEFETLGNYHMLSKRQLCFSKWIFQITCGWCLQQVAETDKEFYVSNISVVFWIFHLNVNIVFFSEVKKILKK